MKTMKKLFSIVLVLALVLSLGISAMAASTNVETSQAKTANIVIESKEGETVPHTYVAYQIFSGTQNGEAKDAESNPIKDDQPLGDIEWA